MSVPSTAPFIIYCMGLRLETEAGIRQRGMTVKSVPPDNCDYDPRFEERVAHSVICGQVVDDKKQFFDIYNTQTDGGKYDIFLSKMPPKERDIILVIQKISQSLNYEVMQMIRRISPSVSLEKCRDPDSYRQDATSGVPTYLIRFSDEVIKLIDLFKDEVRECVLFADIDVLEQKAKQLRSALNSIKVQKGAEPSVGVVVPDEVADTMNLPDLEDVSSKLSGYTFDYLLVKLFGQLGLYDDCQELMTFFHFISNIANSFRADSCVEGRVYPEIVDGDELSFSFEEISFPGCKEGIDSIRYWFGSGHPTLKSPPEELSKEFKRVRSELREKGILYDDEHFVEGLSIDNLTKALNSITTEKKVKKFFEDAYYRSIYIPFGNIALGNFEEESDLQNPDIISAKNILVLSGANTTGKTTLMKAVPVALNAGLTGRKISAKSGKMTVADQIFHNFNLGDNLKKGLSTFKSQLVSLDNFFKSATPKSLGLFDEFLNGTSSIYQLAIGWAILEQIRDKNLRAIVATHDPYLSYFCMKDGYEQIKGIYANAGRSMNINGNRSGSCAMTVSVGHDRRLSLSPTLDSDALPVMKQVFPDLVGRASEIFKHITNNQ